MQRKSRLTLVMMAILLMVGMVGIQPAKPVKAANPLRISQAFGGGGSVGSPYTHDFFEIYNSGTSPVSLAGMSIQYASASGSGNFGATTTQRTELPNVLLGPGQYYLIQEAGGTNGSPLPTPDLIDTTAIAASATGGKVALVNSQVSLGCNGSTTPCGPDQLALIIDLVGFGAANFYEGTAPTPAPSNSTAVIRKEGGCTDTDDNAADFEALTPVARNTASTAHACGPIPPVINEFSASTAGTDVEFVEFFGSPNTDYSAYTLLGIEGDFNATNSSEGFVDNIIALGTTDANGFLLVSLAANAFENGTLSLLLVKDNTATLGVDIDADDNGVTDATYWSEIRDGVAVNDGGTGDLTYATPVLAALYDGLLFAPGGASRFPDGTDTDTTADWVRNDFDLAGIPGFAGTIASGEAYNTPGAANQVYVETAPTVVSTIPSNGGNHPNDESITITFSERVTVTDPWFSISCGTSGAHNAVVTDADPVYTLNPDVNFTIGETCTVTITAANVKDDDTDDATFDTMQADYVFSFTAITPPERCGDAFTPIYNIQGTGETSPLAGTALATEGVVVGDFQVGGKNGYYIQDVAGDGNPATSDGIFVYNTTTAVNVGDKVRVRGTAVEYFGITEISPTTQVWICSTGNTVAPTPVTLPVSAVTDFEKYESMLVTFPQSLIISEYFNFDRYGEIVLTSTRHMTPTALVEPGAPAQAEAAAYLLDRITLDDGRTAQNPDPAIHPNGLTFNMTNLFRGGGTVTNATGILDFYQSLYRLQPTTGAVYADVNPRTTAPDIIEGDLKVASFNVLNYFVTLDGGASAWICGPSGTMECRGADSDQPDEFTRQRNKILSALNAIDADIFGLMEIENDSPVSGNDAVADLVAGLNAINGAGTYAYIDTGSIGGDAIKQAILYKPSAVTPVGEYQILDSSIDSRFIDTANRPVLAQVFMDNETGVEFVVAVNHLKSKGSACAGDPDLGDGAGNCNLTRKAAAEALVDWLANPTYFPDVEKALVIGDLNSYDKEDPIDMIKLGADDIAGTDDDFKDMIFEKRGELAYGYVFDGQTGYLDHALASQSLAENIVDVNFWHINADEPDLIDYDTSFKAPAQDALYAPDAYRSSDHDPVIVTFSFSGDFFVTQDFGPWGAAWVGAYNLGWKYNDPFDINTIASIEVGMLDAAGNLIVKYTADGEQVAWQKANGYITSSKLSSAPFYQEVDGIPLAEGRDLDWTVVFGPSFAAWNPALGFIKVVNLNGAIDYKTVAYTGTGDVYSDIFETQDFGLWGPTWPAAFNLGWKYNDSFDIQTIKLVEVGMIDASGNIIVRYTADLEQVAWQIANSYITPGGQESAPFYREYNGNPIVEGRDVDWTVIFGPSFDSWNPTWAFVKVESLDGQMEYKLAPYLGVPALANDFFVTQDFGPWGSNWVGAYNLGWKYNDPFDINTIASIEVGMLDAAGNLIVRYSADAEQVAWQKANSYITPGGQESAPFYQEVDGIPLAEGRGEDWTVKFGPSFAAWNPALGFVKVVNLNGTVDYKTVAYTGTGDVYSDIFETQDFGLWGPSWPAAFNLGWKYNDSFDIQTIKLVEVGMIDASGNIIVRYTADLEQVAWQIANSYITPGGQESAPFYREYNGNPIVEGRDLDWTVIFGPSFDSWNPTWAFVKVESLDGQMEYKLVPYLGVPALADDIFEITDFGLWGQSWPGALSLGWGYSAPFDTDTIAAIEVGMVDADRNVIVRYTADAEQVAWQKANGYITSTKLSSAPFYQEYQGNPIVEGRDLDWTVIFGPSFEGWSPAWAYVRVITTAGTVDYDEILYTGATPGETPMISSPDLEGPYAVAAQQEFHVTLDNSDLGYPYTNVLAVFELDNITLADIASFEYLESMDGQWHTLPLTATATGVTGSFGPAAGFPIGVPYNATSSFRVTFNTPGTYPATIKLYDVAANPDSVLDIFTAEVEVLPALAVTEVDLEASTIIAGPYTALPGNLAGGFTMVLDPTVPWYYFDASTITSTRPLADGIYPFYLEGTTTEVFTLVVNGSDYFLRDTYANNGTPLRVQGNFPLGAYTYVGDVADEFGFTDEVSLTITFVAPLAVTDADLEASTIIAGPYTALPGNLADGFTMVLDTTVPWYYFDASTITSTRPLADGSYPFYLEGTTTEVFTLVVNGTDYFLRDTYADDGTPLRVQGNFPLGAYTYVGEVADEFGFTDEVSLTITFVAPLAVTEVALVQSADQITWTPVEGSLAEGFAMNLDALVEFYFLDADSLTSNRPLADGSYPFFMTGNPGAAFFAYWADRGVVEGATGWQALMWPIINGDAPMFYLKVEGTSFTLIDGLQGAPNLLRVNGSYYPGLYTFNGLVVDEFGFEDELDVSILFNDVPVAEDQAVTTPEDTALPITLVATDIEGDPLEYMIVDLPTNGTVTLVGNIATYTPALDFVGEDSFTFTANDGMVDSHLATVTITVTEVKDQVQAVDDFYTMDEDTTLTIAAPGVLANDIDVDNNEQAASLVSGVQHGSLSLLGDGSFTYTPDPDFFGTDTFVYKLITYPAPQSLWTDEATVTITVNPIADAPVLGLIQDATIPELVAFSFTATATDVDLPAQVLTFSLVGAPEGAVITAGGVFTWTPTEVQGPGVYTFTVKVCDDTTPSPLCDEQAVTLTVTEVNSAPVALDLTETTEEDTPMDITLVATDAENNMLTYAIVDQPVHGSVTLVDDVATYTPELNFNGEDSFTYKANDGMDDSDMAVVTITVTPVNDAPVAVGESYSTNEDTALFIAAPGLLANDTDVDSSNLQIVFGSDPAHGVMDLYLDGSFRYTPVLNYFGSDSFTYKVTDGTAESNTVTVNLTVNPINDAPIAFDDNYNTMEDTTLEVPAPGVLANDLELDGDTLAVDSVVTQPLHGTLTLNPNGSFTYVPETNYAGMDSFTYKVTDGTGLFDEALVTIDVVSVNDWVVANDDEYETMAGVTLEVAAPGVLINDVLLDPNETVSLVVLVQPAGGTLTLNNDGSFTYVPNAGFFGVDTFEYQLNSTPLLQGEFSDTAIVTIKVIARQIFLPLILR